MRDTRYFTSLILIAALVLAGCGGGGGGGGSSLPPSAPATANPTPLPVSLSITGIDNNAPTALTALHIATKGLNLSAPVSVTFANTTGFSVKTSPISIGQDGTVAVAVPLNIDPTTGQTASVNVSLSLTQGSTSSASVPIAIQDIPPLSAYGATLGQITRTFDSFNIMQLGRQRGELNAAQISHGNTVDTSQAGSRVGSLWLAQIKGRSDVDRIMNNNSLSIPAATVGGVTINYDKNTLALQDRILAWYLVNLAAAGGSANGTLSKSRPVGFTNRKPQLDVSTITGTLKQLATTTGATTAVVDLQHAFAKANPVEVALAIGGGLAVAATLTAATPVAVVGAAEFAATMAALKVWYNVYNIATSVFQSEHAAQKGNSATGVAQAQADITSLQYDTVLTGLGSVTGTLASLPLTSAIQAGGAASADLVVQGLSLAKSANVDLQTARGVVNQINAAFTSPTPAYYGDIVGVANVTYINGVGSPLNPLTGVQVLQNGSNALIGQGMADSNGNYDVVIPLGSTVVNYGTVRTQAMDPITLSGLGFSNMDLTSFNASCSQAIGRRVMACSTAIQAPTTSGSCIDADAATPDGDDPDCD